MGAIFMVVANIFRKQSAQVPFVDGNDVVQQVTTATLNPSFRDTVLPRAFERGPDWPDLQGSNRRWNFDSIFAIPVENEKPRSRFERKSFSQLLDDPEARWVPCDVEVQDMPTIMTDDEQAIQQAESDGWNSEEVHRRDGFPVITKKSEPAFGPVRVSRRSLHPPRNRSLRYVESQHQKLPVDARRSPSRIFGHHTKDQFPYLLGGLSSTDWSPGSRNHLPVQLESSPMPSNYRLWGDHDKSIFPSGPEPSRQDPEEFIERHQLRSGMSLFQRCALLTKRQIFEKERATSAENVKDYPYE